MKITTIRLLYKKQNEIKNDKGRLTNQAVLCCMCTNPKPNYSICRFNT
jgi:hypothetical protein